MLCCGTGSNVAHCDEQMVEVQRLREEEEKAEPLTIASLSRQEKRNTSGLSFSRRNLARSIVPLFFLISAPTPTRTGRP